MSYCLNRIDSMPGKIKKADFKAKYVTDLSETRLYRYRSDTKNPYNIMHCIKPL